MSFDLYFLALEPGESWQDAMNRLEVATADESQLVDTDLRQWQTVLERVRPLLPNGQVFEGERHRQLSDDATGIQLSLSPGELSLTVPYWYDGPDAQQMVSRLRDLANAVEPATGLTAYDPQADAPFINAGER